ncbi:hypothetical protein EDB85DRAFT_1900832 [Lactarius pseudohatsudake]|nr:hypothetical protein EDB85DRAFT_1900832 [Lactarius pseudohatsudake]
MADRGRVNSGWTDSEGALKGKEVEGRVSEVTPMSREGSFEAQPQLRNPNTSGQWHKALDRHQSAVHTVVSGHQSSAMYLSHPSLDLYRIASEARPVWAQAHPDSSGRVEAGHVPGSRDGHSSGPILKAPGSGSETGREIDRSPNVPLSRSSSACQSHQGSSGVLADAPKGISAVGV